MQRTKDLLNLGEYGPGTIRSYLSELRYLFTYYGDVRPSQITYEDSLNYLIYLNKTLGCSRVKSKMAANSFAFFFRQVQNKPYKIPSILFAAHSHKLPPVMEEQEVFNDISAIKNVKHKTLIILLYSTGMRVSEITNLKLNDIDSKLMRIKILNSPYYPEKVKVSWHVRLSEKNKIRYNKCPHCQKLSLILVAVC